MSPPGRVAPILEIAKASYILQQGGVVAIPTDTVYGLAASLDHPEAIERIYQIKGRENVKALPVLVGDRGQLLTLASDLPPVAISLVDRFWPGALTLVLPATARVPESVHRGQNTVGLRMPANEDALSVIGGAGGALAVTSANRSGEPEARTAEEVWTILGDDVDFVLDGGRAGDQPPSTVVDVTVDPMRILRQGAIDRVLLCEASGKRD